MGLSHLFAFQHKCYSFKRGYNYMQEKLYMQSNRYDVVVQPYSIVNTLVDTYEFSHIQRLKAI